MQLNTFFSACSLANGHSPFLVQYLSDGDSLDELDGVCPWIGYFFPLSAQGEKDGELRLRCLLCRPLKLGELNPTPAVQRRASNGCGKCTGGGACHSQPDPKPFLSCALHVQFELPHTSYKLPKSVSDPRASFFLCRLLPEFSSHKPPSPARLLGCWQGP